MGNTEATQTTQPKPNPVRRQVRQREPTQDDGPGKSITEYSGVGSEEMSTT